LAVRIPAKASTRASNTFFRFWQKSSQPVAFAGAAGVEGAADETVFEGGSEAGLKR